MHMCQALQVLPRTQEMEFQSQLSHQLAMHDGKGRDATWCLSELQPLQGEGKKALRRDHGLRATPWSQFQWTRPFKLK